MLSRYVLGVDLFSPRHSAQGLIPGSTLVVEMEIWRVKSKSHSNIEVGNWGAYNWRATVNGHKLDVFEAAQVLKLFIPANCVTV